MNKQELIEKYTVRKAALKPYCPNRNRKTEELKSEFLAEFISDLNQLDEQPKVTVPQFVADWFEKNKDDLDFAIYSAVAHSIKESEYYRYPEGFIEWIELADNKPIETLIRMKDGYEVEKELLYQVIIDNKYLVRPFRNKTDARLVDYRELCVWEETAYKLTESEIKAIDERYWAFAVPVEEVK
ncbi:DUF1642 domain-containing protein [Enterococcus casseliflavus]|uniref:DUF1642 domain-containing protein n=1 Tax=Enterococcus casseliflavus TaxID=37734 RepID=UPI002DBE01B2|nr:DUF1642 domain-containing protein [Enterococcus casseliflavus]MEB8400962.1 DUF1642 domain-containing protein [Enterococcus casseliflavus]